MKIVERVVDKVILQPCARCGESTEVEGVTPSHFPTMAEVERRMLLAAYRRSNRRPLEAARMLGIGKTTMYRKLLEMKKAASSCTRLICWTRNSVFRLVSTDIAEID